MKWSWGIILNRIHANSPIGGYLELELPAEREQLYPDAQLFQSARAAFRALLISVRPTKVYLPKYLCNAMLEPLLEEQINHSWYDIDDSFNVITDIKLDNNEFLLYVNYFGVCQAQSNAILERFPPEQIIFDHSQAFFDPPRREALATIYSVRKFFGVVDGGLLITNYDVNKPEVTFQNTTSNIKHLITRLLEGPEEGYRDYLLAEKELENSSPMHMSKLTQKILSSVDFDFVQQVRFENFLFLHSSLKSSNLLELDTSLIKAPLCYPYMSNNSSLRDHFLCNRVFVPKYWQDASKRLAPDQSRKFVEHLLPLPIDQRYRLKHMQSLTDLIEFCH